MKKTSNTTNLFFTRENQLKDFDFRINRGFLKNIQKEQNQRLRQ